VIPADDRAALRLGVSRRRRRNGSSLLTGVEPAPGPLAPLEGADAERVVRRVRQVRLYRGVGVDTEPLALPGQQIDSVLQVAGDLLEVVFWLRGTAAGSTLGNADAAPLPQPAMLAPAVTVVVDP